MDIAGPVAEVAGEVSWISKCNITSIYNATVYIYYLYITNHYNTHIYIYINIMYLHRIPFKPHTHRADRCCYIYIYIYM